ncbi:MULTISPECIES: cation-translocating P-type ATPase [Trichocoleus]|uniref:Heavy metal translocating P-type ATPase n=1 Tax=Trichocoleus desertorum GB2-A4 TaxID=2933944 RepID=A0ABV0J5Y0_9CYAN|nr:heavy metal translocating P-type ATPase [Trichocoleus sp. FACHB-46]MBD1863303.1 copper-translocating P-type ATPase [Trichocoleus sp. FACHB-46]
MQLTPDQIVATPNSSEIVTLEVAGMKCAGCVRTVEQQLSQHPGVISASVNLVTEVATVECAAGIADPAILAQAVTEAGFPTQPRFVAAENDATPGVGSTSTSFRERHQLEIQQQTRRTAIAGLLLLLSGLGHVGQWGWLTLPILSNIWFHWGLATIALVGPGRFILVEGWRGLRRNAPNMNTLVGLGTFTAYTASCIALFFPSLGWECFFDEPVMLVGFILLGRTLEQRARGRAVAAFEALIALQPRVARLIPQPTIDPGNQTAIASQTCVEIPAERVRVGEWLQVLPGEKMPVDGKLVAGQTTVDESMLTGEALPVLKQPGELVAAGTLNQSGAIAIQATRTGKDTTLAQIIALVETAQTRKAPIQHLADTVAGYFTYTVMAIATVTFVFWYGIGTHVWPEVLSHHIAIASLTTHAHLMQQSHLADLPTQTSPLLLSLKLAIAVLVVACPCALGLATPTAILVGSSLGAEQGLLIRGGDVLEQVHHLDTIVFDKTGTLTAGQPTVTDCLPLVTANANLEPLSPQDLLQFAATVESGARHPLAAAILQQAQTQKLDLLPAKDFYTEPGRGISALVSDRLVVLGNADWLSHQGIVVSDVAQAQAEVLAQAGKTVVYVAIADTLVGLIAAVDPLRPDAHATVKQLQQMGLRVHLLSGDRHEVAALIAKSVGIAAENVQSGIQPAEKAAAIAQLQKLGHQVAMVGDGINDAPALAQANIGISLYSGTDVAVETAEIVLMRDRLMDVVKSIRLSRATFKKIRQNLFWAFAYNILGIPLAAGTFLVATGFVLSPAAAGAMMAFSSVSVVTNSLLLRYTQSPLKNETGGKA